MEEIPSKRWPHLSEIQAEYVDCVNHYADTVLSGEFDENRWGFYDIDPKAGQLIANGIVMGVVKGAENDLDFRTHVVDVEGKNIYCVSFDPDYVVERVAAGRDPFYAYFENAEGEHPDDEKIQRFISNFKQLAAKGFLNKQPVDLNLPVIKSAW